MNANIDIGDMTPSNFNRLERDSQFSEGYTYGGSSAAMHLSEYFHPDLYEEEKVIDSQD